LLRYYCALFAESNEIRGNVSFIREQVDNGWAPNSRM
jgi:hypothetical protein